MKKKLFIVAIVDWAFLSHRLQIALSAKNEGYKVYIVTKNTGLFSNIHEHGLETIEIPFDRSVKSLKSEIGVIKNLRTAIKREKPDIMHNVSLKASIYSSIAGKKYSNILIINAINGLGYSFTSSKSKMFKILIKYMMRNAFKNNNNLKFIFQNIHDRNYFIENKYANKCNSIIIKGSGINLNKIKYHIPIDKNKIIIILAARMLKDKGIIELKDASEILKNKYSQKILFQLVGSIDVENPSGFTETELKSMIIPGYFEWLGFRKDIIRLYERSDIAVLPSYREGLPKALIEACAVGRPIITTNAPGCDECVVENINGFKVSVKDSVGLAKKIEILVNDKNKRLEYGLNSRKLAEHEFDINDVIKRTIKIYKSNKCE